MKTIRSADYCGGWTPRLREWVQNHLHRDERDYCANNGIEDRIKRSEEYLGWLTEKLCAKGLSIEDVKDYFDPCAEVNDVDDD